ncbi:MAG: hypothetical protein R2788_19940 [Saprospiraceae bacterium]
MPQLFAKRFKLTGNPQDLYLSDSLFNTINQRIPRQVGVLQSLTANAITQHAFRKAEGYITEAYNIGEKRFATSLMMVDVLLERGQMYSASQYLKDVASDSHFDLSHQGCEIPRIKARRPRKSHFTNGKGGR